MRIGFIGLLTCRCSLAALAALAVPSSAAAGASKQDTHGHDEAIDEPVVDADRPTRAAPHADCDLRMPLWEHKVARGEHLGGIAGRYGVRRRDLLALNPSISDPNLIKVGESVRVCPEIFPRVRERKTHVVASGETLSELAVQYGLSVDEIVGMQEGKLSDPNRLGVGHELVLWVDGGLVEAFAPPPPAKKKKKARRRGGRKRKFGSRAGVSIKMRGDDDRVHIKRAHLSYGTAKTIGLLDRVVSQYRGKVGHAPKVLIGDISKRGGGKIDPHLSHQTGRDVDVGYVLRGADGKRTRFSGVTLDNLDVPRTWALVKSFLDTHDVRYIFMDYKLQKALYEYAAAHGTSENVLDEIFQYPRGRGKNYGIIRHWRSHRNHFHVRFRS